MWEGTRAVVVLVLHSGHRRAVSGRGKVTAWLSEMASEDIGSSLHAWMKHYHNGITCLQLSDKIVSCTGAKSLRGWFQSSVLLLY